MFDVVVMAITWMYYAKAEYKAASMADNIQSASLVMSCVVLIWAICRMLMFFGSTKKILPKKVTIIVLILTYLLLAIVDVSLPVTFFNDGLDADEKSTICVLVAYFLCTLIFGFIVNRIATLL